MVTELPGPHTRALERRRVAAVAPGVSSVLPLYVGEASGAILIDVDGNALIDLGAGIAVVGVGQPPPPWSRPSGARRRGSPTPASWSTPTSGTWRCARPSTGSPRGTSEKRTVLFDSGAEAVENAVKVARHVTGRPAVVVFDHAYHGRTNLTMALTAKNMPYRDKFGPFAPEVYRVPMSYPYRDPEGMTGEQAASRFHRPDRADGGCGQGGLGAHRAGPGGGRVRGPHARIPARHRHLVS